MEYVKAVRRHWRAALLVVLAVMVPTLLANLLLPAQFTANTRLWVGVSGGADITDLSQGVSVSADLMSTYPELVRSPLVLDPVVSKLGLSTDAAGLSEQVLVTVPNDTLVLDIAVTSESRQQAADTANAVADQFRTVVGTLPQVRAGGSEAVEATVLKAATPPTSQSSPQVVRNLAIALVLGLVLAVLACLLLARYAPAGRARKRPTGTDVVPEWD